MCDMVEIDVLQESEDIYSIFTERTHGEPKAYYFAVEFEDGFVRYKDLNLSHTMAKKISEDCGG